MSIEDILKECKKVKNWGFTCKVDHDTSPGWLVNEIDGGNGELEIGVSYTDMCSLWNRYSLYMVKRIGNGKSKILGQHTATHWARQEQPKNYEELQRAYYKIQDAHTNLINKSFRVWSD